MLSLARGSEKLYINWFELARKSVYTTSDETFFEKYVSTIRKLLPQAENPNKMVFTGGKMLLF